MDHYTSFDSRLGPIHEDDIRMWESPKQHKATVLNDIAEIPETGGDPSLQKPDSESKWSDMEPNAASSTPDQDSFKALFLSHWYDVCVYCLVFGSFGMSVAFLGPTLLDLGCQTTTDLKHMSWVFFIQLLFTLIGSISAGILVRRITANLLLIFTTVGIPIMFFLLPSCTVTATLLFCLAAMGWFMGCVDCIANLQMLKLYGAKVTPFLQMMYFSYGLGAFLSPMIAQPFLLNNDCTPYIDGYEITYKIHDLENEANVTLAFPMPSNINMTRHGKTILYGLTYDSDGQTTPGVDEVAVNIPPDIYMLYWAKMKTEVRFAFYILGSIQVPVPFLVLFLYLRLKRRKEPYRVHSQVSPNENNRYGSLSPTPEEKEEDKPCCTRCYAFKSREVLSVCLIGGSMLLLFDGIESSYGGFIYTYSVKRVTGIHKEEGATINACFWGMFAFGRLLSVFLCTRLTSSFMLISNILGCIASIILLLIFNTSHIVIYLGTCLLGLFQSSCAPSVYALVEQFIDVESSITSLLVVCAAGGEMIFPLIVGNLFVALGPLSLFFCCLTVLVINLILYVVLRVVGTRMTKWTAYGARSFVWLPGYEASQKSERLKINKPAMSPYVRMKDDELEADNNFNRPTYEMGRVDRDVEAMDRPRETMDRERQRANSDVEDMGRIYGLR